MEAKEIRRGNMEALALVEGGLTGLAERAGTSDRLLSQIRNGTRNMGARLARKFEERLGIPHGWMDVEHAPSAADTSGEIAFSRVEQPMLALYGLAADQQARLLALFDKLTTHQQNEFFKDIEAAVAANEAVLREKGGRLTGVSPERAAEHLPPAPRSTPPYGAPKPKRLARERSK